MSTAQINTHLHPVFAGILNAAVEAPSTIARASYVSRLLKMDWQFEHAPHAQWKRGRDELIALRKLQAEIDPGAQLWNKHCHPDFKVLA